MVNRVIPGTIIDYAGTDTPVGYLACDGTDYSQTDFPALFSAIGHTWDRFRGQGPPASGRFRVPLLAGLSTVGDGGANVLPTTSARAVLDAGGEEFHHLIDRENGQHTHVLDDAGHQHGIGAGGDTYVFLAPGGTDTPASPGGAFFVNNTDLTGIATTGIGIEDSGSSQGHNTMHPFVCVRKLIKF